MIGSRGRKILHDILSRKGRTALVSLSIMVGVFGAVTLISGNDLLVNQIKEDINPSEIAMTRLFVTVPSAGTEVDNTAYLETLGNLPGVTEVQGEVVAPVFWRKSGAEEFEDGDIMAFSDPFGEIKLESMRLVDGNWPQPNQQQVVIERRMADEYGLKVGDKLNFRVLGSQSADTEAADWTVAGIVFHPYWVDTGDDQNMVKQRIYANYEDAQHIAGFSGFSMFYLRYTDTNTAEAQAEALMETVAAETNYIPLGYWLDDPDDYFLIGEVQEVTNVLNMLAVVALVVSGFLVTNVINTIIVEQKRQIGVMKSIGATRWDTFVIYAGIALVYGIMGTIPGVLLGIVVGSAMASALAPLAATLIEGFNVSTIGVIVGAVMGIVIPVLAALIPVFNGTRVSILDAMTDLGISAAWGRGPMARLIKALPLPINTRQALSNVVQKKGRLLLTVITLTLATAAFMGVFAMFTVVQDEIDKLYETFNYEIMIIPSEPQDYEQVSTSILEIDEIDKVYPGVGFDVKLFDLGESVLDVDTDSNEVSALGFDLDAPIVHLTYNEGSLEPISSDTPGVVITQPVADRFDKKTGDRIVVSAGGHSGEYQISGIVSYPFELVFMQWQNLSQLAGFVTDDNGTPNDYTDDTPLPVAFVLTMKNSEPTADQVDSVIDQLSERMLAAGITSSYENLVQEQEDEAANLLTFNMIFQITSIVMAAVGAIGLLATLSMAVFERQKEIGVMRSIGARSSTIIAQFQVEGILIGVIAWILALPLSYLLAVALLDALGFAEFIDFHYPLWITGLGLVGIVVIAAIASLWPSIAASRKTVSDILRYQ
jgi:putative ABC transport system permease protein